ncbi:MAG: DUF2249 domain-containing protein [Bacteroidetes bacterium]|nr:DUF2249 domain-containing protein [Bacteroidota bacterium]
MTPISPHTKISTLLKSHPEALDAIVSISPKFNKLRFPLLRKLMAPRTSISMACKIGGCTFNDFAEKLKPLGFEVDAAAVVVSEKEDTPLPEFMKSLLPDNIIDLDVRPVLDSGKDPLNLILKEVNQLQPNQVMKLANSFEPIPLIQLLGKRGFETYSEIIDENLTYTYFHKTEAVKETTAQTDTATADWDATLHRFEGKTKTIDVRELEMPLPMLTILDELDKLPTGSALYVYHKRIPVFLLPELQERKFEYRIKEINDGEVHLFIFK